MLKNCPHCGAANRERANDCYVCESPLPEPSDTEPEFPETNTVANDLARDILENIPEPAAARSASVTEFRAPATRAATALADEPPAASPPSEPEWKREVASKLEEYRSRRQRSGQDSQNALPFSADGEAEPAPEPGLRDSLRLTARSRPQTADRLDIAAQPELDFETQSPSPQPSVRLVPVAHLNERVRAGLLDAAFVTITYGGFLLMFSYLIGGSGELSFGKVDALVYAATCFLIYGLYFTLFTAFGSATPGMLLRGLHVVSFDGNSPTSSQLLWRSFGYLVSAAAAMLGFAWAFWDEDHLTWQDRISQTYLTESPREFGVAPPASTADYPAGHSRSEHSAQSWKLFE